MGRTPAGDAFSDLVFRILRLHGPLIAAGNALAGPAGQSSARWQVLAAIEDKPATVAEIARSFGLARQSVQRLADALVADGLASYEDNPHHRRAKLLRLSRSGRRALQSIQAAQREWADSLGAELDGIDLEGASHALDQVLKALEPDRPEEGAERMRTRAGRER